MKKQINTRIKTKTTLDCTITVDGGKEKTYKLSSDEPSVILLNCKDDRVGFKTEYTDLQGEVRYGTISPSLMEYKRALRMGYYGLYLSKPNGVKSIKLGIKRVTSRGEQNFNIDTSNSDNESKNAELRTRLKIVDCNLEGVDYYKYTDKDITDVKIRKAEKFDVFKLNIEKGKGQKAYTELLTLLKYFEFDNFRIMESNGYIVCMRKFTDSAITDIHKSIKATGTSGDEKIDAYLANQGINDKADALKLSSVLSKIKKEGIPFEMSDDLSFLTDAEYNLLFLIYCFALSSSSENDVSSVPLTFIDMAIYDSLNTNRKQKNKKQVAKSLETESTDSIYNQNEWETAAITVEKKSTAATDLNKVLETIVACMLAHGAIVYLYNIPKGYKGAYQTEQSLDDFDDLDVIHEEKSETDNSLVKNSTEWLLDILPELESIG